MSKPIVGAAVVLGILAMEGASARPAPGPPDSLHAQELPPQLSLTGALAWFCMPPDGDREWFGPPRRTRE